MGMRGAMSRDLCVGLRAFVELLQIRRRVGGEFRNTVRAAEIELPSLVVGLVLLVNPLTGHRTGFLDVLKYNSVLRRLFKVLVRIGAKFLLAAAATMIDSLSLDISVGGRVDRILHDRTQGLCLVLTRLCFS